MSSCHVLVMTSLLLLHGCENDQTNSSTYVLPYPVGKSYKVLQSVGGTFSHQGTFYYSFDFQMDIGTEVHASRDGVVKYIESGFNNDDHIPGHENYIIIRHRDGTFGRYFHLAPQSAIVAVGDHIVRGQQIGYSGNSGFSATPHLHFDVTTQCAIPAQSCQTISVEFSNSEDAVPEAGKLYEAKRY
jgi:murein DD-endopeptidase MepM/ murein hydrolase activator NlpD